MASNVEFVQFVADQMGDAGTITVKRMFGEFGLYCNGKYFAAICDDRLLVKITEGGKALMPDYQTGLPYDGAKPMFFIEDLDNRELLTKLTLITCQELPTPKPRKKR